ncbi:hypothetical protein SLA2020_171480 [Shorea laevis]
MAIASSHCFVFVVLAIFGILVSGDQDPPYGCDDGLNYQPNYIHSYCSYFVLKSGPKIPPSQECCNIVKNINVPCFCKDTMPYLLPTFKWKHIDMDKMVYVARSCGLSIRPGVNCGGYTFPPT